MAQVQVLTLAAVKAGIRTLQSQRIHEHFPAYIHLRQRGVLTRSFDSIEPKWREVGTLLWMPKGPPTKPHYRPFSSRNLKDPSGYWFNENLAGSYAPRSLRATSQFMLNQSRDGFALSPDHALQAFRVLLKGTKVPAWALAAYYLRNYGFSLDRVGVYEDLISAFKMEFSFDHGSDFETLFDDEKPWHFTGDWFEYLAEGPTGVSRGA